MDKFTKKKNSKFALISTLACLGLIGATAFNVFQGKFHQKLNAAEVADNTQSAVVPDELKASMERTFRDAMEWPDTLVLNKRKVKIQYSFNPLLDAHIRKLLKQYRSDYATVTVIDNETGEVLAAVGHEGKSNQVDNRLVLSSTHPSASLIKIITAAELISSNKVKKETPFEFRGRSTTLFKYQIDDSKSNRWDKSQTFETAFAKSNNVIFGKAAIHNMDSAKLVKMAENFGFNQPLMLELPFIKSFIGQANDDYRLAELASGFNDETVISPIHAAAMASIIANNGVLKSPRLVSKVVEVQSGENLWVNQPNERRVLTPEAAAEMKEMMNMTIDGGTARRSFGKMNTGYKNALLIGGKTGSITGGKPFGKRDWFAAFAVPRDPEGGKGISISVMNVNVKKWHVKSTMLAKNVIEFYYNNVKPVPITMVKMPFYRQARIKKHYRSKRSLASSSSYARKRTVKTIAKKKSLFRRSIGKNNERKSNSSRI
jgi:peptidoglycan glycosyltransferase